MKSQNRSEQKEKFDCWRNLSEIKKGLPKRKPLGVEPMSGFEPPTSSLPRKRSTPELHRPKKESGRPGSNRRHSAWKADALPTELLPR